MHMLYVITFNHFKELQAAAAAVPAQHLELDVAPHLGGLQQELLGGQGVSLAPAVLQCLLQYLLPRPIYMVTKCIHSIIVIAFVQTLI